MQKLGLENQLLRISNCLKTRPARFWEHRGPRPALHLEPLLGCWRSAAAAVHDLIFVGVDGKHLAQHLHRVSTQAGVLVCMYEVYWRINFLIRFESFLHLLRLHLSLEFPGAAPGRSHSLAQHTA